MRAPSRALARPLRPAVERLVPALMRPVVFALTHEVRELSALRPASLGLLPDFSPPPRHEQLPAPEPLRFTWAHPPDRPPLPALEYSDLGIASPASFRIDDEGRLPAERDTPATTTERPPPPAPGRYLRPRTPLARAPLSRLDGTAFRLDPRDGTLPNERIIEARPQPQFPSWYLPDYDRDIVRRWFPFLYIWGLGPMQTEWFSYWWAEFRAETLGGQMPFPFRENRELMWQIILRCKEQMLLRRDVKKLEEPPETSEFFYEVQGVGILQHERELKLAGLIEKPEWIQVTKIAREDRGALHPWLDAYSDWRFLLRGLEER